jgi:hypothetical protein
MCRRTFPPLTVLIACTLAFVQTVHGADISDYVGWTVVAKKTIVAYVESDGGGKDAFEGCNFYRKIIFEDNTYLTCTGYGYHYAYRPAATILRNGSSWKMIVDGEAFDMSN